MSDAVVVGAGPNGLAAAIVLARAGVSVRVLEAADTVGGGARSAELTLPGFVHDVCSAIHPLGVASPFFRTLPLAEHGVEWIEPPAALAHPFDDGTAALLEPSPEVSVPLLGEDGKFSFLNFTFNQDYLCWHSQGPIAKRNLEKLGLHDITHLVRFAIRAGLLPPEA